MKTRVISIDLEKEAEFHLAVQKICDQQLEEGLKLTGSFVVNTNTNRQITVPPGPRLYLIFQPIAL